MQADTDSGGSIVEWTRIGEVIHVGRSQVVIIQTRGQRVQVSIRGEESVEFPRQRAIADGEGK